ncbi:MAG: DUF1802 family protein [Cyanobacteria bacterium P01_D01_bin.71]
MTNITWAFKEWAVAVEALLSGELMLLIRKGGIHERRPVFNVPSDRVLLFPTYEHQSAEAMCEPWQSRVLPQTVPQVGETVQLPGWAEITHQLPLPGLDSGLQLRPFHIWTDAWLRERLAWKPERPAFVLLLRVHRFAEPVSLAYQKRYGGCRSWIQPQGIDALPQSSAVLTAEQYQRRVTEIQSAIAPVSAASVSLV